MLRKRPGFLGEARSHMVWMTMVFTGIGVTLIIQPHRYDNTPSYANLLAVFTQNVWGALYLVGAVATAIALMQYRRKVLVSLMLFIAGCDVLGWWWAFVYRYATDSGTTIVNVLSWATDLYLIGRCIITLDDTADEVS